MISNGNITTTADVYQALKEAHPCCGVMSAEGVLANPALFLGVAATMQKTGTTTSSNNENVCSTFNSHIDSVTTGKRTHTTANEATTTESVSTTDNAHAGAVSSLQSQGSASPLPPRLLALFQEYCALSEQYRIAGGWAKLDAHFARPSPGSVAATTSIAANNAVDSASGDAAKEANDDEQAVNVEHIEQSESAPSEAMGSDNCTCMDASLPKVAYAREPRQMYIARQHLSWMLGKTGHGRMVRYQWIGAYYKKHVHLMQDMNSANSIADLLCIAERCLPC